MDGFAVWRVATGVGNVFPLHEIGERLPGRRVGVMRGDTANHKVPENGGGEDRQQEKPRDVNVVFHLAFPF